jgi:hypothetical protein
MKKRLGQARWRSRSSVTVSVDVRHHPARCRTPWIINTGWG